ISCEATSALLSPPTFAGSLPSSSDVLAPMNDLPFQKCIASLLSASVMESDLLHSPRLDGFVFMVSLPFATYLPISTPQAAPENVMVVNSVLGSSVAPSLSSLPRPTPAGPWCSGADSSSCFVVPSHFQARCPTTLLVLFFPNFTSHPGRLGLVNVTSWNLRSIFSWP